MTLSFSSLVAELLAPRAPRATWPSLASFLASLDAPGASLDARPDRHRTLERAVRGGATADRLGYAFVAGYRAALVALVPGSGPRTCLAATEKDGAHPRAIRTTLVERDGVLVLDGEKTFTTLATVADTMLVVARTGDGADGRPLLKVVRVPTTREGVTVSERPPTPFAPEVPHARVTLTAVHVGPDEVLPGDGYADVLKPFRTLEDLHVSAAAIGYLLATVPRLGVVPHDATTSLALALAALATLAAGDPGDPAIHVALAGVLPLVRAAARELEGPWLTADPEGHARLVRDLPLLTVAEAVRGQRLTAALRALLAPS